MAQALHLDEVLELGLRLRELGPDWAKYLPAVRVIYRALRERPTGRVDVSHAQMLRGVLQLGANPLPLSRLCPACSPQPGEPWSGVRTVYMFPDRHVSQCCRCSVEWLVMDTPSS